jgi:hypothetical protein
MSVFLGLAGALLILLVLWDGFETIVLPRRIVRRVRIARIFYQSTWIPWRALARRMPPTNKRESFLSFFGPLSLLLLLGFWAVTMIIGFSMLQFAVSPTLNAPEKVPTFGTYLYMSGVTFFTLGFGDVTPINTLGRIVAVVEGGTGFGFLGLVIGYLPVIYGAFSRREVNISLLDARAGSPPSAAELLNRNCRVDHSETIKAFLKEWERWAADILESHLSYPVLAFFRSQHENQSWLASLTVILDISALILAGVDDLPERSARLTFAMARHAAVDLSQVFGVNPLAFMKSDRLPPTKLLKLRAVLKDAGVPLRDGPDVDQHLAALRLLYEPYVIGLAQYLVITLPAWIAEENEEDDWQRSAYESYPRDRALPHI